MPILPPGVPPEQQALRDRCFHPSGTFAEFEAEEIEQSIPDRFEDQVRRHGARVAIEMAGGAITYGELNADANRIAHAILAGRGDRRERVALLFHHGAAAIAATLGALKAGRTYVPLDPFVPIGRNRFIVEDAQPELLVADSETLALASEVAQGGLPVMNVDDLAHGLPTDDPGLRIAPDALSYLIYTSGSTGQPKGVMQSHRNMLFTMREWINLVHICPEDRLSLLRTLSVVGSIRDLFGGLLSGAAVLPLDVKKEGVVPLGRWLADRGVTIFNTVVTLFRNFGATLAGETFPSVRLIKLSGEPVHRRDLEIYRKAFGPDCLALNMLASSEAGSVRAYFMDKDTPMHDQLVPIGYGLEACDVLLIDERGGPVGFDEIGEIAVRSRYLAPGYWRLPELTAASFLPAPEDGDARIFLTGDLGRMRPDGCLVHLGRKDAHVKIRGFSVELAEVEAVLRDAVGVRNVVVTTRERTPGHQILVAYVVPTERPAVGIDALRRAVAATLPDYMVPSAFVIMDELPLAGPGKVNVRALPEPDRGRPDLGTALVQPRTPVEEEMARIWAEVLGLDRVGIHDPFFELGGDSLLASQVVSRVIRAFQLDVPLRALLEAPTVAEMALMVVQQKAMQLRGEDVGGKLAEVERQPSEQVVRRQATPEGSD